MAIKTLQITLTGSAQQVSTAPIKCQWAAFQNNAAAVMRIGDANVTAAKGISLAISGGTFTAPLNTYAPSGTDLSQWYVIGTATQLLDIVYDGVSS